jgi:transposase
MIIERPPKSMEYLAGADIFQYGFLPVAAAYCRSLGLVELVNEMVSSRMELKPGLVVQAMVLDVFGGRTPLYRLKEFMAEQDIELLIGEEVSAEAFNDNNLGRSLDAIFEAGTSKILTRLGAAAMKAFELDASVVSYDTTSTSVWGDYRVCEREAPPPGPVVARGHSKDHLPELKQFMTELLCVERGVPIFGRTLDGNSSDKKSNNNILTRIGSIMAQQGLGPGAFVYVADSAMVTGDNLDAVGENLFITRLPVNYGECGRVVSQAIDSGDWTYLGALAENRSGINRPNSEYKAIESTVVLYGKTYRALVVYSNTHDRRRAKKIDRDIQKSNEAIAKKIKKMQQVYFCEADAMEAAKKAEKLADGLHTLKVAVIPFEVRRRGRPSTGNPQSTVRRYKLSFEVALNEEGVGRLKTLAGCFVLLSNVALEGKQSMDAATLLRTYKGQYGVESNFAFLKDPLVVNDLFLKTPSRIDALGMVLVIALLVWRLMERSIRAHVENTGESLPGWRNRQTEKPTSFMMSVTMIGIMVALTMKGRILLKMPGIKQLAFISALGLTPDVFINPTCRCKPIIPRKVIRSR